MNEKKYTYRQKGQDLASVSRRGPKQSVERRPTPVQAYQRAQRSSGGYSPPDILRLQQTIGNQALQRQFVPATPQRLQQEQATDLPFSLKASIEALSGFSLDDVNVHYNSSNPAQLQALAYTQGTDIHVGPGQEKHLPHEAWHVVQQKQGRVKPTLQVKGVVVNDEQGLEREADQMGTRALQMERADLPVTKLAPQLTSSGAAVIQRQITFTKEQQTYTPDEVFESFKNSREGQKLLKLDDGEAIFRSLIQSYDGRTFNSRSHFTGTLRKFLESANQQGFQARRAFINEEREHFAAIVPLLDSLFDNNGIDQFCYKLGLYRRYFENPRVNINYLLHLIKQAITDPNVDQEGLRKTLHTLTSIWPGTPTFYGEEKEGLASLEGLEITLRGLMAELEALIHLSDQPAPGERIFSASTFRDRLHNIEQDVDVSFIDRRDVLHLVEAAMDFNALKNKLTGKSGQKERYLHLARKAEVIEQEAVGPLTATELEHTTITGVELSYTMPRHEFEAGLEVQNVEDAKIVFGALVALIRLNVSLIVGTRTYTPEELGDMVRQIRDKFPQVVHQ